MIVPFVFGSYLEKSILSLSIIVKLSITINIKYHNFNNPMPLIYKFFQVYHSNFTKLYSGNFIEYYYPMLVWSIIHQTNHNNTKPQLYTIQQRFLLLYNVTWHTWMTIKVTTIPIRIPQLLLNHSSKKDSQPCNTIDIICNLCSPQYNITTIVDGCCGTPVTMCLWWSMSGDQIIKFQKFSPFSKDNPHQLLLRPHTLFFYSKKPI